MAKKTPRARPLAKRARNAAHPTIGPRYVAPPFVGVPARHRGGAGIAPSAAGFPWPYKPPKYAPEWLVTRVRPDSIWITQLKYGPSVDDNIAQDQGSSSSSAVFFLRPTGSLVISYGLARGVSAFSEAIIVVRSGDGALLTTHFPANLPTQPLSQSSGSIEFTSWPNPFPPELYGYHQLIVELWAISPAGNVLPAVSQTNPEDNRRFILQSTDWAWLFIYPGCRDSEGGLDWIQLAATVAPSTIALDGSGKKVAANQHVKVTYEVTSAGFAPTMFGYNGSFLGLVIGRLGYDAIYPVYPTDIGYSGVVDVDLSGLPVNPNVAQTVTVAADGTTCRTTNITQIITEKKAPQPPTSPAMLHVYNSYTVPPFPDAGQAFTIYFDFQNVGMKPTGPFQALITLNDIDSGPMPVSSLAPGATASAYWPFPDGLGDGDYPFYVYVDPNHQVSGTTIVDYYGMVIQD